MVIYSGLTQNTSLLNHLKPLRMLCYVCLRSVHLISVFLCWWCCGDKEDEIVYSHSHWGVLSMGIEADAINQTELKVEEETMTSAERSSSRVRFLINFFSQWPTCILHQSFSFDYRTRPLLSRNNLLL